MQPSRDLRTMEERTDTPHSGSAPRSSVNEIDELLAEAEALTSEIASGAIDKVDKSNVQLHADHFLESKTTHEIVSQEGKPPTAKAEPLRALDQVQDKSNDLRDLLNDPDSNTESPNDAEKAAPTPSADPAKPKARKGSKFNFPKSAAVKPAEAPFQAQVAVAVMPTKSPTQEAPQEAAGATEPTTGKPEPKAGGLKKKLSGSVRMTLRFFKSCIAVALNCMLLTLSVLDWPFRSMSHRLKGAIGLIGLVTLVMGIMSWVLPGMMHENPFEHMDTGIATAGAKAPAASAEHGAEAAPPAAHAAEAGHH